MRHPDILIVEDDDGIRRGIVDALDAAGFRTRAANDGTTGREQALTTPWDLLLLDLMLPGPDGLSILRDVRAERPNAPVIILTARGEEDDRVRGLKAGADDYVVKPFGVRELLARVEAVLRRSPERTEELPEVPLPDGVADLKRREVRFADGQRCELSEREAGLLHYLARHAGRAIAREELLTRVWQVGSVQLETRTVDMHVARLREKLRDTQPARIIITVRGKGYMFAHQSEPA